MGQYGWISQWSENVIEKYLARNLRNSVKVYDLPTLKSPFRIWSKFDSKCTVGWGVRTCQKLWVKLSETVVNLSETMGETIRNCGWNYQKLWVKLSETVGGNVRNCGWNCQKLCVKLSETVGETVRKCGWNCQKLSETVGETVINCGWNCQKLVTIGQILMKLRIKFSIASPKFVHFKHLL